MKTISVYSALLFIALASVAASPFHFPSQTRLRSPHHRKNKLDRIHQSNDDSLGWIESLDIEKEARAFDLKLQKEQLNQQPIIFASPWLTLAWHWLSGQFSPFRPFGHDHVPLKTTTYTDSLPRYVAYGDAYVNNQSFGVPHPEALKGFTHYNIAFWVSTSGGVDNVQAWMQASETVRKAIVNAYNNAGIRLGMSVFGETDSPLANGDNPYHLADQIADFVEQYNLQGVDVDFEEYDAFENRIATKWVIPLTRRLRARLPQNQYYLSHAPVAPLFNTDLYPLGYTWIEQDIGNLIDFYNIQFYNQDDYSTCHTLLLRSGTEWPNTSLIQLNQVYNIPFEKMIVGKPATAQDADNGYIDPHKLAVCIANFAVPAGWRSGCMWWEFAGDIQTNLVPVLELAGL